MSLFLSEDELKQLTGRTTRNAQIRALRDMQLPFFINAAGRAVVLQQSLGVKEPESKLPKKWSSNKTV